MNRTQDPATMMVANMQQLALLRANASRAMQEIEDHVASNGTSPNLDKAKDALKAILDN